MRYIAMALAGTLSLACQGKESPVGTGASVEFPTDPDPSAKPVPTHSLKLFDLVEKPSEYGNSLNVTAKVRNTNSRRVMFYPRAHVLQTTFSNYGTPQETSRKDSLSSWVWGPTYIHQLAPREVGVISFSLVNWDPDNQVYEISEFRVLTSGVDYRSFMMGEMLLSNFREYTSDDESYYLGNVMNATNSVLAKVWVSFWMFDDRDRFVGAVSAREVWDHHDNEWLPGEQRLMEVRWGHETLKKAARWEFHPAFIPVRTIP